MYRLKEGNISSHGLEYLLITVLITKFFLGVPRAMVEEGNSAGWILLLFSSVIASAGVFIILKLLKRFPGQNLIEIAETLWGRAGSILVSLAVSFLFIYMASVVVREFAETILTTVLPRTPISLVILVFLAVMMAGAYQGLETISRASTLLFPFILFGILSILILTVNFVNLNNLFPILGTGLGELAYHAPGRSSLFLEVLFVTLIISNISDPDKVPVKVWKAFISSVVLFIIVQLFYTAVLRVAAGERLYVPLFQMARIIYMGRFIQRIEAIYIFVWFFSASIKLTLALYGAAVALSRGFRIPIYQPLLFPLGLIVFSASFIPAGIVTAVYLDMGILREYGGIISWGLPSALLLTAILRKKGGAPTEKEQN